MSALMIIIIGVLFLSIIGFLSWYLRNRFNNKILFQAHENNRFLENFDKLKKNKARWLRHEKELFRLSKTLSSGIDKQETLKASLEHLILASEASRAHFFEWPVKVDSNNELVITTLISVDDLTEAPNNTIQQCMNPTQQTNLLKYLQKNKPIFYSKYEVTENDLFENCPDDVTALAIFPIFHEQKLYGFIRIEATSPKSHWSMEDEHMLPHATRLINQFLDHKIKEEALKKQAMLYEDLCENAIELIYNVSLDGRIAYANTVFLNTLGYSKSETHALEFMSLIHPDTKDIYLKTIENIVNNKHASYLKTTFIAKNGNLVNLEGNVHSIHDTDGNIISTKGFFLNITHKEKIKEKLSKLSQVIDRFSLPIIEITKDGKLTYMNHKAKSTFRDLQSLDKDHPVFQELITKAITPLQKETEAFHEFELSYKNKQFHTHVTASETDNLVQLFFFDMTDQKEAEDAREEFIDFMAHEMRSPLSVVQHSIHLLKGQTVGALNDQQQKLSEIALRNLDRMNKVVHNILRLSKLESGVAQFEHHPTELDGFTQSIINTYEPEQLGTKKLVIDTMKNLPQTSLSQELAQSALTNLIDNALRYAKSKVTVKTWHEAPYIQMSIIDDGPGIDSEDIQNLFNKFTQAKIIQDSTYKGTGLGLVICKRIVELHKGRIWVESIPNVSTTFHIQWPIHQPLPQEVITQSRKQSA